MISPAAKIARVEIAAYRIPTDQLESDGTLDWDHTEIVIAIVTAGRLSGLGWSYASRAAATLASDILCPAVVGRDALQTEQVWQEMNRRIRNAGRPGVGSMAIASIDIALWDLKAKLLDLSLVDLFGAVRDGVAIYGSGGFTSYSETQLTEQLGGWAEAGIPRVKMKIGRDPDADPHRVKAARKAIGADVELFVDANGAYAQKQALALANLFAAESDVVWFEEPVSSDDLEGLNLIRDRGPAGMDIAAGEYGDTVDYFRRMVNAGAVDCLQADVTRCGGYTGFLKVASLCESFHVPLSAHCAPQLHAHVGCAVHSLRHVEYFHDHTRIDDLIFDGTIIQEKGILKPDRSRTGHGITLKTADAEHFRV